MTICQAPLNRVALHRYSSQTQPVDTAQQIRQTTAKEFCRELLSSTLKAHTKLEEFDKLWPTVMARLVHRAMKEFSSIDDGMRTMLEGL